MLLALLIATALAVAAPAQVTVMPGSGCPNAPTPTHSPTARIGQTFQFGHSCPLPRTAFAILGLPGNGAISFGLPYTCVPGPCVWSLAPIAGSYYEFPMTGAVGSWQLPIPNVAGLVGTTWAIQCGCNCT